MKGNFIKPKPTSSIQLKLSIIIVSYNCADYLDRCLDSIARNKPSFNFEVIIVDNNSIDGTHNMITNSYPWAKMIINRENVGFARANNQGIEVSKGEYLLLLNPDTVILPYTLERTIQFMEEKTETGILGCTLINSDGKIQPSCGRLPTAKLLISSTLGLHRLFPGKVKSYLMVDFDHKTTRAVDWVCAAFFLIRRKVINEIGYLDHNLFLYGEEMDFCRRAKLKGWTTIYYSEASVIHYGGMSIMKADRSAIVDRTNYVKLYSSLYYYFGKYYGNSIAQVTRLVTSILLLLYLFMIMVSVPIRTKTFPRRLQNAFILLRIIYFNLHLRKA